MPRASKKKKSTPAARATEAPTNARERGDSDENVLEFIDAPDSLTVLVRSNAFRCALAPITKQLQALNPLLRKIASSAPPTPPARLDWPIREFSPVVLSGIAYSHLALHGAHARWTHLSVPTATQLGRQAASLRRLLRQELPRKARSALEVALADLEALHQVQSRRRKRGILRKTCAAFSCCSTDVMTWLLQCAPLASYEEGQLYEYGRQILAALTKPTCPACGLVHRYRSWRTFRDRDRQRRWPREDRQFLLALDIASLLSDIPVTGAVEIKALGDAVAAAFPSPLCSLELMPPTTPT